MRRDNTECFLSYIRHSVGLKQPKKLPNLQACSRGIWKTKPSFMNNKTCFVAHNYTLSTVNRLYALKMIKEMLMNLCYKIYMKKLFRKKSQSTKECVRDECVTTVTTQISINVIKNILKDAITVYWDLCVSVAFVQN